MAEEYNVVFLPGVIGWISMKQSSQHRDVSQIDEWGPAIRTVYAMAKHPDYSVRLSSPLIGQPSQT